jgi:hypothetical protein
MVWKQDIIEAYYSLFPSLTCHFIQFLLTNALSIPIEQRAGSPHSGWITVASATHLLAKFATSVKKALHPLALTDPSPFLQVERSPYPPPKR